MLKSLHVKNLALIEEADISFDKGLTIFSGETGAGKSILLESIHLALGGRASKDLIRSDKEYALVELTFAPETSELMKALADKGVWPEDSEIIISRKITADKSLIRINGETVGLSFAKEIGELLLDIHGQNEHQSLLKKSQHISILDEFGREAILPLKTNVNSLYKNYKDIEGQLSGMNIDEAARLRELDYLEYEINEIEAAAIQADEEDELNTLYKKLSNSRSIMQAVGNAHSLVSDTAGEAISHAAKDMGNVSELDGELGDMYNQLLILESEAGELARALQGYLSEFYFDEQVLEDTAKRLDLIRDMEKKYGGSVEAINDHLKKAYERRDELINMEENRACLEKELKAVKYELSKECDKLTKARAAAAKKLEQEISFHLSELNFAQTVFVVNISEKASEGANGRDDIEFLISMNKGETPKPLEHVASGGELSRIMLAVKTVLASMDPIETQIFDEIDAGISGITASCVAKKLKSIGAIRQVFCISHLPQIVAAADNHYLIEKHSEGDKTVTNVERLDEEGSVKELARILGGDQITALTLENARELKKSN